IVFPGESASDQEILARSIVQSGSNAMRVSFAPYCTNPDGFLSRYNSTILERAIRIAETFDLWIIVDYHGYSDVFRSEENTSELQSRVDLVCRLLLEKKKN